MSYNEGKPVSEQRLLKPGVKFNNHFAKWHEFVKENIEQDEESENKNGTK